MTPEEEIHRANEARMILDNPMFREACERLEQGLAGQRRQVPIRDTDMHTRLVLCEQLWVSIKDWLEQLAQTGKMVQIQLDRERTAREKLEETVRIWRRA